MTDTARREYAIRVENLGYALRDKRYQLGPRGYGAAKSAIAAATASVGAVSTGATSVGGTILGMKRREVKAKFDEIMYFYSKLIENKVHT